jgi:hypothetical protein
MKARTLLLALVLFALPLASVAQEAPTPPVKVSVTAKGDDVRTVLGTIFAQAKKQYVLPVNFRFALYLSLEDQEFEKALDLVCKHVGLEAKLEEGIYHVRVLPKPAPSAEPVKPVADIEEPVAVTHEIDKKSRLPQAVLGRRLTTRLPKADLRVVFDEISRQTEVPLEVADDVPGYKIDAFLIKTSLKYALDSITKATKLRYRFTDEGSIRIEMPPKTVNE